MSIDLSLSRVKMLFNALPLYKRLTIHVAGTNGKGSVTAILSSIFHASHISVGRFNSPHLIDVWDAISINGHTVSEDAYRAVRTEVQYLNDAKGVGASNFEIMTATAAQIFERAFVDIAIFEVGLGGRLDATNVLPDNAIVASVITSIDLDHQQFLGNTLGAIAREKAGIARKGRPCILGSQRHSDVEIVVGEVVHAVGAHLVKAVKVSPRQSGDSATMYLPGCQPVKTHFLPWQTELEFDLPLLGAHQLDNLGTALTTLGIIMKEAVNSRLEHILGRISPSTLYNGVLETRWPGRLQSVALNIRNVTVLVDGAHNAASATALQSYLMTVTPIHNEGVLQMHSRRSPRTFILGLSFSPGKTPMDTLSPLLCPGDRVALVGFTDVDDMPWVKNVPLHELEAVAWDLVKDGEGTVHLFQHDGEEPQLQAIKRALMWAVDSVKEGEEIILAGSLYLVADFFRLIREQDLVR
ncbi:Mur ligase [Hysterangium stoloniferum]|nr:Mur ligase [Hysterangium stoloniferum]